MYLNLANSIKNEQIPLKDSYLEFNILVHSALYEGYILGQRKMAPDGLHSSKVYSIIYLHSTHTAFCAREISLCRDIIESSIKSCLLVHHQIRAQSFRRVQIDFINEVHRTPESEQIDAYQCRVLTAGEDLMADICNTVCRPYSNSKVTSHCQHF